MGGITTKQQNSLVQTVSYLNSAIDEQVEARSILSVKFTGASCVGNTIVGVGKLLLGILSLSLFTCVSALYTFGMVIAKCCVIAGIARAKSKAEQYAYYSLSGLILLTASVLYIAYSVRLFFYPEFTSYHIYVGITIAAVTFTELTLNIRGVIIERHNHTPLIHAIKMINLASSMICLVLTQTAILSFADAQSAEVQSSANGLIGIIMGGIAAILGVAMVFRIKRLKS